MPIYMADGAEYENRTNLLLDIPTPQKEEEESGPLKATVKATPEEGSAPVTYDTQLTSEEEPKYQAWKQQYAPQDSGEDYDLRGAFKEGLTPSPENGHWPDTYKKPNHPTFSNESIYAKDRPDLAGSWNGEEYIPPTRPLQAPQSPAGAFKSDPLTLSNPQNTNTPTMSDNPALEQYMTDKFIPWAKSTWPAKTIEGFGKALTLPGRVAKGEIDLNSEEGHKEVTEMALNLMGQGTASAPLREAGVGIFGGRMGAQNTKEGLELMKEVVERSATKNTVDETKMWNDLGAGFGPEGKFRYEISDDKARLKTENLQKRYEDIVPIDDPDGLFSGWTKANTTPEGEHYLSPVPDMPIPGDKYPTKLSDILDHPELYKAYPDVADIKLSPLGFEHFINGTYGWYSPDVDKLALRGMDKDQMFSTLMHEVQHAVQDREGFARGSSPAEWTPRKKAYVEVKEKLPKAIESFNKDLDTDAIPEAKRIAEAFKDNEAIQNAVSIMEKYTPLSVVSSMNYYKRNGKEIPDWIKVQNSFYEHFFPDYMARARLLQHIAKAVNETDDLAHKMYQAMFGEAESRMTQERLKLTPEERRKIPPWESETWKKTYIDGVDIDKNVKIGGEHVTPLPSIQRAEGETSDSIGGPISLANEMGTRADWDKFMNLARKSENVEDMREVDIDVKEQFAKIIKVPLDKWDEDVTDLFAMYYKQVKGVELSVGSMNQAELDEWLRKLKLPQGTSEEALAGAAKITSEFPDR